MGQCHVSDNSPPRGSVRVRVRTLSPAGGYLRRYFRRGLSPGGSCLQGDYLLESQVRHDTSQARP